jgi:hypothetical protein
MEEDVGFMAAKYVRSGAWFPPIVLISRNPIRAGRNYRDIGKKGGHLGEENGKSIYGRVPDRPDFDPGATVPGSEGKAATATATKSPTNAVLPGLRLAAVDGIVCELCFRMRHIGIAESETFVMPFTQIVLADAVGLTPVHVNRVVRKLRDMGALEVGAGTLVIADITLLGEVAGFDDSYLHRRFRPSSKASG